MTYRELINQLIELSPWQMEQTVTVYVESPDGEGCEDRLPIDGIGVCQEIDEVWLKPLPTNLCNIGTEKGHIVVFVEHVARHKKGGE